MAQNKTKLSVGFWGQGEFRCDSSFGSVLYTGGEYDITITLLSDRKRPAEIEYQGISDWTWPENLLIKVCQLSNPEDSFQPSVKLLNHMELEYYVMVMQAHGDSVWRATGHPPIGMTAPEYHFAFRVPSELADSYLCFMIEWNHQIYGYLKTEQPLCAKIVQPCSEEAQHMVWRTHVNEAQQQGKFDLAISLADSFIALGWHDLFGLRLAETAAKQVGRYDDAIHFLDVCFEANHTVDLMMQGQTPSVPTEVDRQEYQRLRTRLLEAKTEQQNQER